MIISEQEREITNLFLEKKYDEFSQSLTNYLIDKEPTKDVTDFVKYLLLREHTTIDYRLAISFTMGNEEYRKMITRVSELIKQVDPSTIELNQEMVEKANEALDLFKQENYGLLNQKLDGIFAVISSRDNDMEFLSLHKTFSKIFKGQNGSSETAATYVISLLKSIDQKFMKAIFQ